jgi:hypothetical protein
VYIRAEAGHPVKIGRQPERVSMYACRIPTLLICKKDDDIGPPFPIHLLHMKNFKNKIKIKFLK